MKCLGLGLGFCGSNNKQMWLINIQRLKNEFGSQIFDRAPPAKENLLEPALRREKT